MTAHAKLGASNSATWMNCAASPRISAGLPNDSSVFAEEGTRAHAQAEAMLKGELGPHPELAGDVQPYVDLVMSYVGDLDQLLIEQTVPYDEWVHEGFGTADAIILHADRTLTIIDLKFGKGERVDALGNSQLRLYSLGAVQEHGFTHFTQRVRMIVCQPRLDHVSVEELEIDELLLWGQTVKARAQATQDPTAIATPGDKQCRWCRARAVCRARAISVLDVAGSDVLTPAEFAVMLPHAERARTWAKDVESHALAQALNGTEIPGYKLVEGRSVRAFTDNAPDVLRAAGLKDEEFYRQSLKPLGEVEKALGGKKTAAPVMDAATVKPKGEPVLVPNSDKRTKIDADITSNFPEGI